MEFILLNATHITINNIYTLQNANGLLVQNSRDVQVIHSRFENALIAGAQVVGSTNVDFADSVFDNDGFGLFFAGSDITNQDCSVTRCKFPSAQSQNLFAQQISGITSRLLLIFKWFLNARTTRYLHRILFSSVILDLFFNDLIIKK